MTYSDINAALAAAKDAMARGDGATHAFLLGQASGLAESRAGIDGDPSMARATDDYARGYRIGWHTGLVQRGIDCVVERVE